MKKVWKIILIILLVLIIGIAALLFWQRDNITALYMAMTHDSQEIAAQMSANDAELKKQIETYFPNGVRDFTEDELLQIEKGEITEKEALAKIISEAVQAAPSNGESTTDASEKNAPSTAEKEQEIVSRYVFRLYAMEGEYIGKIEGLVASAIAEYKAKRTGQNNRSLQLSIGASYVGRITALEGECDGRVEALLSEMSAELDAIGADKAIINTIRTAYRNEKSTKRAYYMSKYGVN